MILLQGTQKKIVEHLEKIGYAIDYSNDLNIPVARKKDCSTMIIAVYDDGGGILLRSMYIVSHEAKTSRNKYLEYVNHLNNETNLALYYIGEYDYDNLMVSYWFPDIYSEDIFNNIIRMWEADTTELLSKQKETNSFIVRSL